MAPSADHGDPGRVVAPVLELVQGPEEEGHGVGLAGDADDAAHGGPGYLGACGSICPRAASTTPGDDPTLDGAQATLSQVRGFEQSLDDFLADCSAHSSCAFHHHGEAASAYDASVRASRGRRSRRRAIPVAR